MLQNLTKYMTKNQTHLKYLLSRHYSHQWNLYGLNYCKDGFGSHANPWIDQKVVCAIIFANVMQQILLLLILKKIKFEFFFYEFNT